MVHLMVKTLQMFLATESVFKDRYRLFEGWDTNPINEMTAMISLQRQFEMQLKLMKTAEEIDASSASLLRAF